MWTRKDEYRLLELNRKIMWTSEEAEEATRLEDKRKTDKELEE